MFFQLTATTPVEPPPVSIDQVLCTGCELCVEACPQHVLNMRPEKTRVAGQVAIVTNPDMCTGCAQCEDTCPDFCIVVTQAQPVLSSNGGVG